MSADRRNGTTNRHGLVGDFAEFAPRRLSMDEIVAHARRPKGDRERIGPRVSREISREQGYRLVRYRLNSDEVRRDLDKVGGENHFTDHYPDMRAIFGVLDGNDDPHLVLDVIDDDKPEISFVFTREDTPLPADVVLEFLRQIDVPASWRAGSDYNLSDCFDLRWDKATGNWEAVEPRHLVKVTFERTCFGTRPVISEAVDVLVATSVHYDLADADPDKAYWAKSFYRERAFEEFGRMPSGSRVRPGFSSWSPNGEPQLVKLLNDCLDKDFARLTAEQQEADTAPPAPAA